MDCKKKVDCLSQDQPLFYCGFRQLLLLFEPEPVSGNNNRERERDFEDPHTWIRGFQDFLSPFSHAFVDWFGANLSSSRRKGINDDSTGRPWGLGEERD